MGLQWSQQLYGDIELDSFEIVRLLDQTLDSCLQRRTNQAIREVIRYLLDMNLKSVKVIRKCKDTSELPKLAREFSDDSEKTLEFCTELKNCLKKVEDRYSGITDALKLVYGSDSLEVYVETQQELKKIKDAGDPFNELKNNFQSLSSYLLGKLETSKKKLDKELKTIQTWRRTLRIIITVTLSLAVICSEVAAAKTAPTVAAGLAAVGALGAIPLAAWIDSYYKKHEDAVKVQKVLVMRMEKATHRGIMELNEIEVVFKRLENRIEHLLSIQNVDFGVKQGIVKIEIEKIKVKIEVFVKDVKDLEVQAGMCIGVVQLARTEVQKLQIVPSLNTTPSGGYLAYDLGGV